MRFACWMKKAADTHSEYAYLLLLHCKMVTRKLFNIKIIRTLPVFIWLLVCRPEECQATTSVRAQRLPSEFFSFICFTNYTDYDTTVWVMRTSWSKPQVRNIHLALRVTSRFALTILNRILPYEIQQPKTPNTAQSVFTFFVNGAY